MAERLMKKCLKEANIDFVQVSSRGLQATGELCTENACKVLKMLNADARKRKSVKINKFDLKTLYIAMTPAIKDKVKGRVILMRDLCNSDIEDPYGQDVQAYLVCAKLIYTACQNLTDKLIKIGGEI